jgi:hypothetical protein
MGTTEFITADELLKRLARWEDSDVAHRFIRDLALGFRAEGNGFTAWAGYYGYHWARTAEIKKSPEVTPVQRLDGSWWPPVGQRHG